MKNKTNKITSAIEVKCSKAGELTRNDKYFIGELIQEKYTSTNDINILCECERVFSKLCLSVFLSSKRE